MRRSNIAAWALIVLGALLLLHQFDIVWMSKANLMIAAFLFLGAILLVRGYDHPQKRGILGGSFFLLLGLMFLFMRLNVLPTEDMLGAGLIFIALGLANLIFFFITRTRVANVNWAIIFLFIGAPFLIVHYNYMPDWELIDYFRTYWPVLLILIGALLLIESFVKRAKTAQSDSQL